MCIYMCAVVRVRDGRGWRFLVSFHMRVRYRDVLKYHKYHRPSSLLFLGTVDGDEL